MTKQNDILRLSALHSEVFRAHYPDGLNNIRLALAAMMVGNVHASVADYADRIERHIDIRMQGFIRARNRLRMVASIPDDLFIFNHEKNN